MNRLFAAPVLVAATILLCLAAVGMGWIWLRAGRPDHLNPVHVSVLLIPVVLLLAAAFHWGVDDGRLAVAVWGMFMIGAAFPAYYALRVIAAGSDGRATIGAVAEAANATARTTTAQWPFAVGYGLMYLAISFCFVLWLATWVSRLPPPPGASAASPLVLRARLLSLEEAAPGLQVNDGPGDDRLSVTYRYRSGKRNIHVRLRFDAERHQLFSRTYEGIGGDRPLTRAEARMSQGVTHAGDLHPDADYIYSASWTVTPHNEAIRKRLGVRLSGNVVELSPETVSLLADDNGAGETILPHLLVEVVHQSGWYWRGRLIF